MVCLGYQIKSWQIVWSHGKLNDLKIKYYLSPRKIFMTRANKENVSKLAWDVTPWGILKIPQQEREIRIK